MSDAEGWSCAKGRERSGACCNQGGEGCNSMIVVIDPQPIAEIVPERQAEAGLH